MQCGSRDFSGLFPNPVNPVHPVSTSVQIFFARHLSKTLITPDKYSEGKHPIDIFAVTIPLAAFLLVPEVTPWLDDHAEIVLDGIVFLLGLSVSGAIVAAAILCAARTGNLRQD